MKDIILNDDFDLEATAGELSCRESDEQTLALLMETQRLKRHIQECMKRNGIEWERIEVEGGVLTVKMKTQ